MNANNKADKPEGGRAASERRRLQMADIARMAGVSVSTVSRALSGSSLINSQTSERIKQLADSLNYSINLGAQNLRMQKNMTVGVVVPYDAASRQHISDPFFLNLVGSLADSLTEHGYDVLLSRVEAQRLDSAARLFDSGKVGGLIVIGQWRQHDMLNALAARKVPLVVWGGQLPQQLYCSVGGDNVSGGEQVGLHLLRSGRRRVAFLGDAALPEVALRREGFLRAHASLGVVADSQLQVAVPFEPHAAGRVIEAFCDAHTDFDAVFACSDVLAIQAMQSLRKRARRVPEDVAVVGYDDILVASLCDPALTTVHQPIMQAGATLVETLLAVMGGESKAPLTLPVSLIRRASAP